ncbi:MAG: zeta toxin family protein [Propionibacteriaceae bacterium]|nr:zeta toxin family protein [Propionibacteriaceae bacterium]
MARAVLARLQVDLTGLLWSDPDSYKEPLLRAALADGSYESFIKPPEVKALESGGEVFDPLELAALLNAETWKMARRARMAAIDQGANLVLDGTLTRVPAALDLCEELSANGYEITVLQVDAPLAVARANACNNSSLRFNAHTAQPISPYRRSARPSSGGSAAAARECSKAVWALCQMWSLTSAPRSSRMSKKLRSGWNANRPLPSQRSCSAKIRQTSLNASNFNLETSGSPPADK